MILGLVGRIVPSMFKSVDLPHPLGPALRVPGQRTKRRAWQKRVYKSEWTKDDAERALAAFLMKVEPPKPTGGMTLAEAAKRYLATKPRKRTLKKDERMLKHLQSAFGTRARSKASSSVRFLVVR